MKHAVKVAFFVVCQFVFTSMIHAGIVIDISNAIEGNSQTYTKSKNNILGSQNGYFGAQLFTDNAANTSITAEFLGSEAKWNSWFSMSGLTIQNHPGQSTGVIKANANNRQQGSVNYSANSLLGFTFYIDNTSIGQGYDWTVSNGENGLPRSLDTQNGGAQFWTGFEYNNQGDIIAILLGLDDGYAPDEDNDDLVIRLSGFGSVTFKTTEVPLPAGLWLLMSGLGLLGAIKRRR
jgi:hypothetical protein